MNLVILSGIAKSSPKMNFSGAGAASCSFSVETVKRMPDGKEFKSIHRVTAYGKDAEEIGNKVDAGVFVEICGELRTRSYEPTAGDKRYITEVVVKPFGFSLSAPPLITKAQPETEPQKEEDLPF